MHVSSGNEAEQLAKQRQHQDLLIAELNHRVRNTLALVRSIARQARSSSTSIEHYVEMLEKRISALSKAHDLVGGSGLQFAKIADLIEAELKPFRFDEKQVSVKGSATAVRADVAPLIALLFHEMTSNSVKHGALSEIGGTLAVSWHEEAGGVALLWQEDLPIEIEQRDRNGFGFALIQRAIPYECNGKASIEIEGKRLKISFWLPTDSISHPAGHETNDVAPDENLSESCTKDLPKLNSALIVEDNLVLAMELEHMLLDLGIETVDSFPTIIQALAASEDGSYQCAVMDINLGEQNSFGLAAELLAGGTPVVFASGYDSKYELPESLAQIPRLVKPICMPDLVSALSEACREQNK
jgi:two-component sensor histidine kinase